MTDGSEGPSIPSSTTDGRPTQDGRIPSAVAGGPNQAYKERSAGRNKVERIADHGKGLISDVTAWIELKMKLVQVKIEEQIDARVNDLIANAIVAALGLLGLVFLLTALSLGAGAILIAVGLSPPLSYFLGFLLIAVVLGVAAGIVRSSRPHVVDVGKKQRKVEEKKLTTGVPPRDQLGPARHGTHLESPGT